MSELKPTKNMVKYQVRVFYTRPDMPVNGEFLNCYYVKAPNSEELIKVFYHAFEEAHPNWTIKKVETSEIE